MTEDDLEEIALIKKQREAANTVRPQKGPQAAAANMPNDNSDSQDAADEDEDLDTDAENAIDEHSRKPSSKVIRDIARLTKQRHLPELNHF